MDLLEGVRVSRVRPVPLIALVVVLASCAGSGGAPNGGGGAAGAAGGGGGEGEEVGGDACRFLTVEEVATAFGVDVSAAAPTTSGSVVNCAYNDAEGNIVIAYSYVSGEGQATFQGQRDIEGAVEVEGIGDGALWFPQGGMYVLKGDAVLNIGIGNVTLPQQDDEAALRAAFEDVARAAAARM